MNHFLVDNYKKYKMSCLPRSHSSCDMKPLENEQPTPSTALPQWEGSGDDKIYHGSQSVFRSQWMMQEFLQRTFAISVCVLDKVSQQWFRGERQPLDSQLWHCRPRCSSMYGQETTVLVIDAHVVLTPHLPHRTKHDTYICTWCSEPC